MWKSVTVISSMWMVTKQLSAKQSAPSLSKQLLNKGNAEQALHYRLTLSEKWNSNSAFCDSELSWLPEIMNTKL